MWREKDQNPGLGHRAFLKQFRICIPRRVQHGTEAVTYVWYVLCSGVGI